MSNPEEITFQLDTLLTEVEETQAAVEEVEAVFASPADLLGEMDMFEVEPSGEESEPEQERSPLSS